MGTTMPEGMTKPLRAGALDEHEAKKLLAAYGVPVVGEARVAGVKGAVAAADELGYPVVMKGAGRTLLHKTERNLVHLALEGPEAVARAAAEIEREAGPDLESLLVQPMVGGKRELMVGFKRDEHFGPVLLVGVGGVLAEALDDVVLGLAPLEPGDAERMIAGLRSKRLLGEFRGEGAVDSEELVGILQSLSRLAVEHPEIGEVDVNPLKVTPSGALVAVDALVNATEDSWAPPSRPKVPPADLLKMFEPKSVAFVGASSTMGKWGYLLVVNTIAGEFQGRIHLVNPRGGTILERPVYKRVDEIPGPVDLAVVTVPAAGVLEVVAQCKAKGVRRMVLITSGFGEAGEEGVALERELVEAAREADLIVLGPNTMGVQNPPARFYCTGSTVNPEPGGTAMISQSGNLGTQLLAFAEQQGLSIRAFAGSGNEAMVAIEDLIDAFGEDDATDTILLYVESVKNGPRFFETARRVCARKPVVLLKGGQSSIGRRAAASHTGALATDDRVFDAMCEQAGIIKVEQPMELLDLAAAFSSMPLPRGPRVAIMTWGGGWGVVTADLCERIGLAVPDLDRRLVEEIDAILPPYWNRMNPIDLVGEQDPSVPSRVLGALAAWDGCDAVINLGILGRRLFMTKVAAAAKKADKRVNDEQLGLFQSMLDEFERQFVAHSAALMEEHGKPVIGVSLLVDRESKVIRTVPDARHRAVFYDTPEGAVKALSAMVRYRGRL